MYIYKHTRPKYFYKRQTKRHFRTSGVHDKKDLTLKQSGARPKMLEFGPLGSGPGHDGLDSGNFGSSGSGWEESLDQDWLTGMEGMKLSS